MSLNVVYTHARRQLLDEQGIPLGRLTAESMIHVQNRQLEVAIFAQGVQNAQKRHRVCAARDGNEDVFTPGQEAKFPNGVLSFFSQGHDAEAPKAETDGPDILPLPA
jgi:hypothetical protein